MNHFDLDSFLKDMVQIAEGAPHQFKDKICNFDLSALYIILNEHVNSIYNSSGLDLGLS